MLVGRWTSDTRSILEIMLGEVKGRLQEKGMYLKVSREVEEALIRVGFHQSYGARALQRAIKRQVEDQLADAILHGTIKEGEYALLFLDSNGHMKIDSSNHTEIFFFWQLTRRRLN
ncbi:hypothetical protein CDL15_Pgr005580 [Punica granatum]|uniref:Clp ATPase C-terminal domain-containing protein n=1 Tax=Punica granatum TaxID=22663 RepID=A0A218WFS6_PUNGR|nr:hypothetical protein CDL15_Pgr005580 [Punica granatum]PKI52480.1 hypothetical protein CRG98_027052 [Punica granatum]